jgi:ribosomal protein L16 Arg81 hydroxylase
VHEVFVLQIAGRKRWQLYEPVIPLPHRSLFFKPELYTGQARWLIVSTLLDTIC